ncbi:terminase large subunit domain-containing protein [Falsiroseomonas selenitidurans]|uniref:Terminase large subunit n=1 Tax=Falsiroseomonas selenitidurans TaxID=2716335 RepID=A0ABX1DZC8_9PROT|nr:terminase large subunit [Falsiroseomonas selenitidurans]NKC30196.1 terminase large subunit [Falsiroseomonas selenitidurans]
MSWDLSCPDWVDRLRNGKSLVPDLPQLDRAAADRAVTVFDRLRLADVPGTPLLRDAAGDWFRDIVRALFGSIDPATKQRMIREVFCLVPKKNSKTSYGALLMLVAILRNERPKARFIMTAPTQDITELAFGQVSGAIRLDVVLNQKFHIRDHLKTIVHRKSQATLEIMSFDPAVLTGQKPAGIFIDEVHVVSKMAKAANAIRQLRGGMIAAPESFMVMITTQSEEPPAGVFRAELAKARDIRDGKQDGAMLPVLYEFPPEMQADSESKPGAWRDPANWAMVTPNAGRSITIARLIEEYRTALATSPEELRAWASQHLNVEIGLALRSDAWAGAKHWEGRADRSLTLPALIARSEVITIGIDGGGLDDLLGLAVLGRERGARRWFLWCRAWAHRGVLDLRKSEAPKMLDLEADGDLVFVDDLTEANSELAEIVVEVEQSGLLAEIGLDMYGTTDARDALAQVGIEGDDRIVGIQQGWRLNGTIKTMETRLASATLIHGGQALMAWCVGNAKVVAVGNAISITKQASGTAKIDPLIAAFCAGALMVRNPQAKTKEVWAVAC